MSHDGLFCVAGGISGSCYIWEVRKNTKDKRDEGKERREGEKMR